MTGQRGGVETFHTDRTITETTAVVGSASDDEICWSLLGDPELVCLVRRRFGDWLGMRWGATEATTDAELVMGELLANAMFYAAGRITASARIASEHGVAFVYCEVSDSSQSLPIPRPQGPCGDDPADGVDEHGRGLVLVRALAALWGTRLTDRGKTVWFVSRASSLAKGGVGISGFED
jgi:anti-sigma regulatory factor (Ser/Thr protein kinase)